MSGNSSNLVHATAVKIGEASAPFGGPCEGSVLLLGESGAGKSDVGLRLIGMGAKLIADDRTALFASGGRVCAGAPPALEGRMELHGVGIVNVEARGAISAPVVLTVRLEPEGTIARLPEPSYYRLPPELSACPRPPLIVLRPFEASTPTKIAAAAFGIAHGRIVAGIGSAPSGPFL